MRTKARNLIAATSVGVAAMGAVPALADAPEVEARFGVARVATWADDAKARQRAAAEAAAGPFAPLVGEPDYGSAEAGFGAARSGHVHAGQDMFAPAGTPLIAVADGVVADAGADAGQGNYVHLYDPEREQTYVYMHMIEPARVGPGARVEAGQQLGGVGCTGSCWGDHLHFEIRAGRGFTGEARDPLPSLRQWERLERPR